MGHGCATMKADAVLGELEAFAKDLNLQVSYEAMSGQVQGVGGLCKVRGQYRVIVDRRFKAEERLQVLAEIVRRFDLSSVEIPKPLVELLAPPVPPTAEDMVEDSESPSAA